MREDALLLNDGSGTYRVLPMLVNAEPGSFSVAFDYDGDGDEDIFRGSHFVPGAYGISPKSYLLENRGGGDFVDVSTPVLPTQRLGLLTAGVWLPEKRSLMVVGEWTAPIELDFTNPRTVSTSTFGTGGWWSALAAADVDGDGDTDLIGGNLGLNTRLRASPGQPLRLYVKDFDQNGTVDPLLTHYQEGAERLFIGKDELVAQLPQLRKRYPKYAEFAQATFQDVIPEAQQRGAVRRAITQLASVWWEQTPDGWTAHPLPDAFQLSPVHAIARADKGLFYFGGNELGFGPAIGRLGAQALLVAKYDDDKWSVLGRHSLLNAMENTGAVAVRAIAPQPGTEIVFLGANDGALYVY